MKRKHNKRDEFYYWPYQPEEPNKNQLIYLVVSVSIVLAAFLTILFL